MTISDMLKELGTYNLLWLCLFLAVPLVAWLYGAIIPSGRGTLKPHKYVYGFLVYLSCIPGMFSAILCGYSLFFIRANLLDVNPTLYFLPIVSMVATLVLIRRKVNMDNIPGFDRLMGLCTLLGVTFILLLIIAKTRIFIFFGARLITLVVFFLVLFF